MREPQKNETQNQQTLLLLYKLKTKNVCVLVLPLYLSFVHFFVSLIELSQRTIFSSSNIQEDKENGLVENIREKKAEISCEEREWI